MCGSTRWVGWRQGPEHEGWLLLRQCVPCGAVRDWPAAVAALDGLPKPPLLTTTHRRQPRLETHALSEDDAMDGQDG